MPDLIAPGIEELRKAYEAPSPNLAGHQQAEAVLTSEQGITVLCTGNPTGNQEQTSLLRISDNGSLEWQRDYTLDHGVGRAIVALPDGFLIAGELQTAPMQYQGHLLRVDAQGQVVAQSSFGPSGPTGFVTTAELKDESILAGGTASWKGWLLRTNINLNAISDQSLEGTEDIRSVAALPDGGFVTAANTNQSTTALGLSRLTVCSQDGSQRWQTPLPANGRGEFTCITVMADGNLAAAGHRTSDEHRPAQVWFVLVDSSGGLIWEKSFGGNDTEYRGRGITTAVDHTILVASDGFKLGRRQASLTRLSQDGALLSQQSFGSDRAQYLARSIAPTADNGCVLVGSVTTDSEKARGWIVRLDNTGHPLWEYLTTP
jgi:hypothetical protein